MKKDPVVELAQALEEVRILPATITRVSKAMDAILTEPGGLNMDALVVLIAGRLGRAVAKHHIRLVLETLPKLHKLYCR